MDTQHSTRMLKLLESGEKSDLSLRVVGGKLFHVHLQIIYADVCQQSTSEVIDIDIDDVTPDVFHFLFEYIYSGEIQVFSTLEKYSDCKVLIDKNQNYGKELIDVANRFELIDMKVAVENILVEECITTIGNMAD